VAHYGSPAVAAPVAVAAAPQTPKAVAPASTPVPTTAPTPVPSPATSAKPAVVAPVVKGEVSPGAPAPETYSLFKPLALTRTASLSTLITIGLLLILLTVYLFTHLAVWRNGLKRWRSVHYRLYAAAQVSGLTIAIVSLAATGFGKVG
jgi:hypothetical protein